MLDAEALYRELLRGVQLMCASQTHGWWASPRAVPGWLERLQKDMRLPGQAGVIHRPCTATTLPSAACPAAGRPVLPFDVNGADILILDDVLYTGRTLRAVINELFDYGRPASVKLAVLVDRGGRELPVQADFAAARVALGTSRWPWRGAKATASFQL
jgi:pyrimidine operon attenuation protein/uracil phosphoribosyltransferase